MLPPLYMLRRAGQLVVRFNRLQSTIGSTLTDRGAEHDLESRPFSDVPGPSGIYSLPYIGTPLLFKSSADGSFEELHVILDRLHEQYGDIFRLKMGSSNLVVTSNPADIEKVYKNEGRCPNRPGLEILTHYVTKQNKPKSLGLLNGEKWYQFRHQIQKKLVRPKSALSYIEPQAVVSRDLVEKLKTMKPEELRDLLFSYASESIGVVCFNKRLGLLDGEKSTEADEYFEDSKEFFKLLNSEIFSFPFYKYFETPSYKRFAKTYESIYQFGNRRVVEAFEVAMKRKEEGTLDLDEPNFLISLLTEDKLSTDQITIIMVDLLIAGNDSTAKALEIFLMTLARHPEVQQNLYEEIQHFIGKDGDMTAEILPKMKYLHACVKESMRLTYPIVSGSSRILSDDVVLSGYHIPKETCISLNNRRIVMDEKYAPEPYQYKPERWMREEDGTKNEYNKIPAIGMIPFGIGVRNCIGRRFAEQEIYLAGAKILQNFKIGLVNSDVNQKVFYHTFAILQDPPLLTFTERR